MSEPELVVQIPRTVTPLEAARDLAVENPRQWVKIGRLYRTRYARTLARRHGRFWRFEERRVGPQAYEVFVRFEGK